MERFTILLLQLEVFIFNPDFVAECLCSKFACMVKSGRIYLQLLVLSH